MKAHHSLGNIRTEDFSSESNPNNFFLVVMFPLKYFQILIILGLFHFSNAISPTRPTPCGSELQKKILQQIFTDYNKDVRPPPGDNATLDTADAAILNIPLVDEANRLWKIDMFIRQAWNDPRLAYQNLLMGCNRFNYISLITQESVDKVWKPNLFFSNEIEGTIHTVIQPNVLIRIFPNGDVLYSVHVAVTLQCNGAGSRPGELLCPMSLYSYGLTVDDLVLKWAPSNAIQITRSHILLDDYVVGDINTRVDNLVTFTGTYNQITADFHFLRKKCIA